MSEELKRALAAGTMSVGAGMLSWALATWVQKRGGTLGLVTIGAAALLGGYGVRKRLELEQLEADPLTVAGGQVIDGTATRVH